MKGADQCPVCGSDRTATFEFKNNTIAGCKVCQTLWEPFDPATLLDDDDQYSSFKDMCDNCAFRPGSPEREDKETWKDQLEHLALNGIPFMCHKGVPISRKKGETHDHPKNEKGLYDINRSRFCRFREKRLSQVEPQARGPGPRVRATLPGGFVLRTADAEP